MKFTMRLFQHPNGYWYAELSRNHRRSLGTRDKAEAQKLYRRLKSEFLLQKITTLEGRKPTPTCEDFFTEYLDHVYQTLSYNTFSQARSSFRALEPYLAIHKKVFLDQINRHFVDHVQGAMTQTAKASTVNTRFRNYHTACARAVDWGYLKSNPFDRVKALQEQEAFPRYLTQEEITAILQAETHPRYLALWKTLLLTGCRRKEVMGLTWADIDLPDRRISIKTTKNKRPRIAWITDDLMETLQSLSPGVGRLFPWSLRQASRRFSQVCARVGIKARLHDLRHTYGSYLAMAGIDLLTIKNLMGHRDIQSTQIYAHLSPDHLAQAQTKLANALNLRQESRER
jgi:integrase